MKQNCFKRNVSALLLIATATLGWTMGSREAVEKTSPAVSRSKKSANLFDDDQPLITRNYRRSAWFNIDATNETHVNRSIKSGACEEETSKHRRGLTVANAKVSVDTVSMKECAPFMLQEELASVFNGTCPSNRIDFENLAESRHSRTSAVTLTPECLCAQELYDFHQKIPLNPLRIFNGPPYSELTEVRGCSLQQLMVLLPTEDRDLGLKAFQAVSERLAHED